MVTCFYESCLHFYVFCRILGRYVQTNIYFISIQYIRKYVTIVYYCKDARHPIQEQLDLQVKFEHAVNLDLDPRVQTLDQHPAAGIYFYWGLI